MVDELIVWEGSLNLEVRIFWKREIRAIGRFIFFFNHWSFFDWFRCLRQSWLRQNFFNETRYVFTCHPSRWNYLQLLSFRSVENRWGLEYGYCLSIDLCKSFCSSPWHGSSIGSVRTWWRVWIHCRINFNCSKKRIVDLSLLWSHELENVKSWQRRDERQRWSHWACQKFVNTKFLAENQTNWKRCHKYIFLLIK